MKTNARRKFIATLLALSLILTGFPGTAVWAQTGGTDQTEEQAAAVSSEQPVSHVASVDSSGKITARRLGQATITASVGTDTAACVVTVKIPDGVYYIKSATSGFCLGTSGSIANGTTTTLQSRTTTDPQRIFQLWQVTHLENGVCYSIQPLNKTSMMLTSPNSAAEIREISSDDSGTAASTYSKWYLSGNWLDGFLFKANNSGAKYLQPNEDDASVGTPVITEEYDSAGINVYKYYWDLEQVTGVSGFLLYDGTNFVAGTPPIKYAVKEKSYTLLDFGLHIYTYGENANQTLTWSCRNANGDTVSSDIFTAYQEGNTYRIRINAVGTYTVTSSHPYGSVSFAVNVLPFSSATGLMRNVGTKEFLTTDNASVNMRDFYGGPTQKWTFTHMGDGYYTIASGNNRYLSVNPNSGESHFSATTKTGAITDDMKWKIIPSGDETYVLKPLIGIVNNQALSSNLQTSDNSNGGGNAISWELVQTTGAIFVAIIEPDVDEEYRTASFDSARASLQAIGHNVQPSIINDTDDDWRLDGLEVAMLMATNRIFYSRSHGAKDKIDLLVMLDFSISVLNSCADDFLSECELVLYGACLTGEDRENGNNLVNATVNAGAQTVVGFDQVVGRVEVDNWGREFFAHIREGFSVETSCATVTEIIRVEMAETDPDFEISTDSYYIGGLKTASFGQ